MAEFDPSKPFTTVAEAEFDPSKPFTAVEPPTPRPEKSQLQSIRESLGNMRGGGAITAPIAFAMNPTVQDLAARGLGYAGGLARTALAAPTGAVSMADALEALKGHALSSSEYAKKMGVPEGPKIPMTDISARDVGGFAADLATDPLMYLSPATKLEALTGAEANAATKAAGQSMYKAGLKKVDQEVAKYGKAPVSDILMRERVTGSARSIADQMDELAANRLAKRDNILSRATATGVETDVGKSLEQAKSYVQGLRAQKDPRLDGLINRMQGEIDQLESTAARPEVAAQPPVMATRLQPELMELPVSRTQAPLDQSRTIKEFSLNNPVSGYVAEGERAAYDMKRGDYLTTVVDGQYFGPAKNVLGQDFKNAGKFVASDADSLIDLPVQGTYKNLRPAPFELALDHPEYMVKEATPKIPRQAGPTPEQMTAMKTNSYSVVGDAGYNEAKATPLWKRFEKLVGSGQKQEVERSVGQALGAGEQQALAQTNDELGRLLTSQEKAEQAARIADNKNAVTSVDAMIGGHAGLLSPMLWLKKAADVSKESRFRTNGGLLLNDLGNTQIPAAIYRREVSQNNPWKDMK